MGCGSSKKAHDNAAVTVAQAAQATRITTTPIQPTPVLAPPQGYVDREMAARVDEIKRQLQTGLNEPELVAPSNDLVREAVTAVSRVQEPQAF